MTRSGLPTCALLLLLAAALLVASKLGLELLGGRAATSVLTGTDPGSGDQALLGVLFVLAHFGSVILAPILALAALFRLLLERRWPPPALSEPPA